MPSRAQRLLSGELLNTWMGGQKLVGGKLILYHGTLEKYLPQIKKSGLKPPSHMEGDAFWFMLTSKAETARSFNSELILKVSIPKKDIFDLLWQGEQVSGYGDVQHAIKSPIPYKYIEVL